MEEQVPWKDLLRLIDEMPLDFTAYYDNEEFIGFTIVYPYKSYNWFWYFAVREEGDTKSQAFIGPRGIVRGGQMPLPNQRT